MILEFSVRQVGKQGCPRKIVADVKDLNEASKVMGAALKRKKGEKQKVFSGEITLKSKVLA